LGDHRAAPRRSRHRFNPFRTTPITPARQTTRALTELGTARARVLASTTSGLTRQQIDTAVTLAVVGGLVVTKMRAGRRWGRPALIVVAPAAVSPTCAKAPALPMRSTSPPAVHHRRCRRHVPPAAAADLKG